MKKFFIFLLLVLCGCGTTLEQPKETIETIDDVKYSTMLNSVDAYLYQAEMKYTTDMMYATEKECYNISELNVSSRALSGRVCYKNNTFVAENITFEGFVCNGKKNEIKCEEVK